MEGGIERRLRRQLGPLDYHQEIPFDWADPRPQYCNCPCFETYWGLRLESGNLQLSPKFCVAFRNTEIAASLALK
jgi:hypothetical protein